MPYAQLRALLAEATLDRAEHAYRLTVTATNDRSDDVVVVNRPDHASEPAIGTAPAAADAAIADDTVDDFDAQPTAYRVRTPLLDTVIATAPVR